MKKGLVTAIIAVMVVIAVVFGIFAGNNVSDKAKQIETLIAESTEKDAQIDELTKKAADLDSEIANLTADATDKATQIDTLTADAADKATQIDTLTADAADKATQIDTLTADATDKAAQIEALTTEAADKAAEIAALTEAAAAKDAEIADKQTAIDSLTAEVEALKASIAEAEAAAAAKAEEVTEAVEEKAEEVTETVEEKVEEVTEAVEEKAEEVTEAVEEKAEEVTEAVEEKAEEVTEAVEEKAEEVTEAVEEKVEEVAEAAATKEIEIGTSGIMITVPADYEPAEISAEDTDENQVAYYKSATYLCDFDLYQWAKAEGETLEAAAAAEAAEYGAEAMMQEVNGIAVWAYAAVEESEGTEYNTMTCLMENGDYFAEIVFWMDGEDAGDIFNAVLSSLTVKETAEIDEGGTEIVLGTSNLMITTPVAYVQGEISAEDTDESQVAYYTSEESLIDFDVYQWTKAEGETLEGVATAEAAEYEAAEIFEGTSNSGVLFYGYYAEEEFEGKTYTTLTVITEAGNDFVEIVFWLDGEDAELAVTDILGTLAQF